MFARLSGMLAGLGPGLLYAGAAVGVSHLVMSTKAGANYEFLFLLLIPLIHLIKYPFYKFGPQYTALTGRNILHGYFNLGRWALLSYVVMTLLSMCLIQAAVTIVTSSLVIYFFAISIAPEYLPHIPAIAVLLAAAMILYIGQYSMLDKMMKAVIIVLTITTVSALTMVIVSGGEKPLHETTIFNLFEYHHLIFLAAFIGWMPAPMDVSVWHSVWAEESMRNQKKRLSMQQAMLDFKVGFFGTALLAMAFLSLGALVMYGSGESPSANGATFAGQLITLYTDTLGEWAYPLIGIAALATMFSTTLTCLDAYPRTLEESYFIWKGRGDYQLRKKASNTLYRILLVVAVMGTIGIFILIKNIDGAMGFIVTMATVLSFISAPVLAYLNHKVMHGSTINVADRPSRLITLWSHIGIGIMVMCSLGYLALLITH